MKRRVHGVKRLNAHSLDNAAIQKTRSVFYPSQLIQVRSSIVICFSGVFCLEQLAAQMRELKSSPDRECVRYPGSYFIWSETA